MARSIRAGVSRQQCLILVLVAVLGGTALALAAFFILSMTPPGSRASSAGLPSTLTPLSITIQPTSTAPTAAAVPASCAQKNSGVSTGIITQIIDGSTIEVQVSGRPMLVSPGGIDVRAKDAAAQLATILPPGQPVLLVKDVTDRDTAGRLVRYIFAGERFVNYDLVYQGAAVVIPGSPDTACAALLQKGEKQARAEHLGIWVITPVPTRTFLPMVPLDNANQPCACSKNLSCADFRTHQEAQACFNTCNDYSSKLDDNHDGIACENLP